MCGIGGHAGRRQTEAQRTHDAFAAALRHRGPDSSGTVDGSGWELTHTRLAIVDLSPAGNQPMSDEDGTWWLSFNGEIYNAPELRAFCESRGHRFRGHSDSEVILHLWEIEGIEAVRRLNGIFAFAIANRRTGDVFLARDPVGVKPLFYSATGDDLWFASELRALHDAGAPLGGFDEVALAQFLTFLWIPDPRTPFEGARSLQPGHVLRWSSDGMSVRTVVDLVAESVGQATVTATDAAGEIETRTADAVRRQLQADVPLALMASGGIDSSLIWWAAHDALDRAYTIDWSGDSSPEALDEDTATVRMLGDALGTKVSYIDEDQATVGALPRSGDLFADPAFDLCRLIASQAASDGYKVLFSGQGGDEVFGGYRRHVVGPVAARMPAWLAPNGLERILRMLPSAKVGVEYAARAARAAGQRDHLAGYMQLCTYSTATDRARVLDATTTDVADDIVWERHREVFDATPASWGPLRRFRALDLAVYLPGLGLAYADRAGMEHGVEIRVPLADLELVRWALRLEDRALVRGRTSKWLTRALAADVLPERVAQRPKRGFAVPSQRVEQAHGSAGERGFRQSTYLASASAIVDHYRAAPFDAPSAADS